MAQVEVKVPDIGDFKDVAVIEVMVKVGETIAVDTGLVMVESDKASMEIPSTHAGVVKDIDSPGMHAALPAQPFDAYLKNTAAARAAVQLRRRVAELERALSERSTTD